MNWWIVPAAIVLILAGGKIVFAVKTKARNPVKPSNDPRVEYMRRIVVEVLKGYGYETTITSGEEPEAVHGIGSLHYKGLAEDYRSNHINRSHLDPILRRIQSRLGDDYDFILEFRGKREEHFHGEFDPGF